MKGQSGRSTGVSHWSNHLPQWIYIAVWLSLWRRRCCPWGWDSQNATEVIITVPIACERLQTKTRWLHANWMLVVCRLQTDLLFRSHRRTRCFIVCDSISCVQDSYLLCQFISLMNLSTYRNCFKTFINLFVKHSNSIVAALTSVLLVFKWNCAVPRSQGHLWYVM